MKKVLFVALVLLLTLGLTLPMGTAMAAGDPPDNDPEYVIAAHAVVQRMDGESVLQNETAWADCNNSQFFPGNNWAWYFTYPGNNDGGVPWNGWGLFAGKYTQIGAVYVNVDDVAGTIEITYDTTGSDWWITETHVAVADPVPGLNYDRQWEAIPHTRSGNPKVGKFTDLYGQKTGEEFDPPVQTYTYFLTIPPSSP